MQTNTTTNYTNTAATARAAFVNSNELKTNSPAFDCNTDNEFEPETLLRKRDSCNSQSTSDETSASTFAKLNNGKFVRKIDCNDVFVFECELEHRFLVGRGQLADGNWCPVCVRTLESLRLFAERNGGELLNNQRLNRRPEFRCGVGHRWQVIAKKATLRWCKECTKS